MIFDHTNGVAILLTDFPLVTIVIPAYNHARYLKEAIDSVLRQDYPKIELIVLDDGSTDATRSVLEGYGDRFFWASQVNMGQASTLNKGWGMAKGEILAYLSADDALLRHAVAVSVKCLQLHPEAALCYGDFQLIDPASRVIRDVIAPEYSYSEMIRDFVCAPGPGAFFRKTSFIQAGGWNPELRQFPDYEYWLRLGLYGKFVRLPEQVASFRVHEQSQTFATATVERAEEALRIVENYFRRSNIPENVVQLKPQALATASLLVAQLHLRAGRYHLAFIQLGKAVRSYPFSLFSRRAVKMLFNGFFNKIAHRLLWAARSRHKIFR